MPLARHRRRLRAIAAGLGASVLLAACGDDDQTAPVTASEEPANAEDRRLEHIHGLGINPADGRLFIATHNGLFAAEEGETTPKPVGESTQDVMGFSVVGPDRFIGSGHPAPGQALPPNLGLIESRDGGTTWKSVSLLGETDFHALESSGEMVYGFDSTSGRLMASDDAGRSWQERTPPAGVYGLAVDPADPSRIVASTEDGIFVSPNAGDGWRPLRDDLGGLLAWPAAERLYLVDGEGEVLVSSDGGTEWESRGSIGGQPAAFAASDDDLYAALADGTVKRSTDGGATWTLRTSPT